MLPEVIEFLACPVCGEELVMSGSAVACENRHSFDVARQGYVNLLRGSEKPGTADTAEMVRARAEFLAAGHYAALATAIAAAVSDAADGLPGCLLEAGAGTGYYLAAALERAPGRLGLALDISKEAAKSAARSHPRAGAVVADTWSSLPVRSGVAAVVMDVFAPRNLPEFARVLVPGGAVVVATPTERHLAELIRPLSLLSVDERKDERLQEAAKGVFLLERSVEVEALMELSHSDVLSLVRMGPSARHRTEVLEDAVSALAEPVHATLSATLTTYRAEGLDATGACL